MGKRTFSAEYREEAVKMVLETGPPIAAVARDLGINEGTLGNWVNKYRDEHPASEVAQHLRAGPVEGAGEREPRTADGTRLPEKSRGLLREGAMSEKYALIAAEKADPTSPYPVIKMCVWLEVSTSGFYDHCNALPSTGRCAGPRSPTTSGQHTSSAAKLTVCAASTPSCSAATTRRWPACRRTWSGRSWPNRPGSLSASRVQDHHPARS